MITQRRCLVQAKQELDINRRIIEKASDMIGGLFKNENLAVATNIVRMEEEAKKRGKRKIKKQRRL